MGEQGTRKWNFSHSRRRLVNFFFVLRGKHSSVKRGKMKPETGMKSLPGRPLYSDPRILDFKNSGKGDFPEEKRRKKKPPFSLLHRGIKQPGGNQGSNKHRGEKRRENP